MKTENKAFLIIIFSIFVLGFGIDLYAPSFPDLVNAFQTTPRWIQLSIPSYLIGYALGLVILGPIADHYGIRKVIFIGITTYLIFCMLSTFTTSIYTFLTFRIFQGFGAASIGVIWPPLLSSFFSRKELAIKMSYISIGYRISPLIAPLIGGYLLVLFGWEANFYFLSLYLLFIFAPLMLIVPRHPRRIESDTKKSMYKHYITLLRRPNFLNIGICLAIPYAIFIIFIIIGPFFIQDSLGYSPIFFGHLAFLVGIMNILGGIINRLLLHKLEAFQITNLGTYALLLTVVVQFILSLFYPTSLYVFIGCLGFITLSSRLIGPNLFFALMDSLHGGKGTAAALLGIIQTVATVLLTFLASYLKSTTIQPLSLAYLALGILCFILSKKGRQIPQE